MIENAINIALLLAILVAYLHLYYSITTLKQRMEEHRELIDQNWREHKEASYDISRKHEMLLKALNMKEIPVKPASYSYRRSI